MLEIHLCYRYTCVTDTLGLQTHLGYLCKCYILTCVIHYRHTCVTNMFVTQTCLYTDTQEQSLPSNTDNRTGCFDTSCNNNNYYSVS